MGPGSVPLGLGPRQDPSVSTRGPHPDPCPPLFLGKCPTSLSDSPSTSLIGKDRTPTVLHTGLRSPERVVPNPVTGAVRDRVDTCRKIAFVPGTGLCKDSIVRGRAESSVSQATTLPPTTVGGLSKGQTNCNRTYRHIVLTSCSVITRQVSGKPL